VCAAPVPESQTPGRPRITPLQWGGLAVLVVLLLSQMGILNLFGRGGLGGLVGRLPFIVAILISIPVHEFSHGFVATLFGDDLPRRVGRLTLNPLKHLDPLGTIMILIGPIGWGRPMPINPSAMRNPNAGWALSSIAGPISNVIMAILGAIVIGAFGSELGPTGAVYLEAFVLVNVSLAVFNLVPLPPLDGFGFLFGLAPRPLKLVLMPLQQYGPLILLAVLFLPPLRPFIDNFMGAGAAIIIPPLEDLCQCRLIA